MAAFAVGGFDLLRLACSTMRHWNMAWFFVSFIAGPVAIHNVAQADWFQRIGISQLEQRIFALFFAVLIGSILVSVPLNDLWTRYWVMRDTRQGTALVSDYEKPGAVGYQYRVDGRTYSGGVRFNMNDHRYATALVGNSLTIHYSASHPSLSTADVPTELLDGGRLVFVLVLGLFEVSCLIRVIAPA